jgi:hypothetical protein
MVVYYDTKNDFATMALRGSIAPNEIDRSEQACDGNVVLYFNATGHLIAVELRDPDMLHPDLSKDAIQMRPIREGDL